MSNKASRNQKWVEKQLYGYFEQQTKEIAHELIWTGLKRGHLKREIESLLIASLDNSIRNNHLKGKIDNMQKKNECWLCGDNNETVNHVINKSRKLTPKEYKLRHGWEGKVI